MAPIKRSQALAPLSKEHHFDLLLVWKLRQGIKNGTAADRMASYTRYVYDQLIVSHFNDEEVLLFDRLREDDAMCRKARDHHRQLRALVSRITTGGNEDVSLFKKLSDLLEEHVRYEERELFPYLEQQLSPATLSETEKKLEEGHKGFTESWEDAFWGKS